MDNLSITDPFPLLTGELWKYSHFTKWHNYRFHIAKPISLPVPLWHGQILSSFNGYFTNKIQKISQLPEGVLPFARKYCTGCNHITLDHENPLLLFFSSYGQEIITAPYIKIYIPSGVHATLIEIHQHEYFHDSFAFPMQEIFIAKNSSLNHSRIWHGKNGGLIAESTVHVQGEYSLLQWASHGMHQEYIGKIFLEEEKAQARCQHIILSTEKYIGVYQGIYHKKPYTISRNIYRSVISKASASFRSYLEMEKGIYQTNGHQKGEVILLDDQAKMYGKPELKIYADDVMCTHGMAISSLSEEQVLYLETRGIPKKQAEYLIIQGFLYAWLNELYSKDHFFYNECDSTFFKRFPL